jgi:hypothetical protein
MPSIYSIKGIKQGAQKFMAIASHKGELGKACCLEAAMGTG